MIKKILQYATLCMAMSVATKAKAQSTATSLVVNAGQVKATIQPTMWGVFFEDINFGADGGIYAELIKNRSFEFYRPLMGWKVMGKQKTESDFLVINRKGVTANPRFLRVTLHNNAKGTIGLNNEGFRGMGIRSGVRYDFSVMYRLPAGKVKMHLELITEKGTIIGSTTVEADATSQDWSKVKGSFTATATEPKAKLNIWLEGDGPIDLDMISLFPGDTWKNRPGGMRADMIQMLADMKPGFIRFPGGCIVEGRDLENRYQWKRTIGPLEDRQLIMNRWNTEFANRSAPDYFQTFGLGFFEYFQLAEDIGAAPLPILNCGMACQFNSAEVAGLDELQPYVQDALDLIEFANGDVTTPYGKIRETMGHPAPFHLTMMGVGNENWGPQYIERLQIFTKAIKAKYPDVKLINSSGTDPNGGRFDYLNGELRQMKADFIDEHYYRQPDWFLQNAARYDQYDRNGPKIFAGEYSARTDKIPDGEGKNNWQAALAEAAFMTGLERNADVVNMASYAPLFSNADAWQWTPDLLWVNNLNIYGTPNYYVQKLFSVNKGSEVVTLLDNNTPLTGKDGLYGTACVDKSTGELILKLVNVSEKEITKDINITGVKKLAASAKLTVLKDDLAAVNSFTSPARLSPVEAAVTLKGKKWKALLAPYSFTVLRVKMN